MPDKIAPLLSLDIEHKGTTAIVYCHGKLIAGVTDILYTQVRHLLPEAKHVILDLTDLTYMDSMGLGTLVRLYVHTKSVGSTLQLIHLGKRIRELLGVTGLLSVFSIVGEHGVPMKF